MSLAQIEEGVDAWVQFSMLDFKRFQAQACHRACQFTLGLPRPPGGTGRVLDDTAHPGPVERGRASVALEGPCKPVLMALDSGRPPSPGAHHRRPGTRSARVRLGQPSSTTGPARRALNAQAATRVSGGLA